LLLRVRPVGRSAVRIIRYHGRHKADYILGTTRVIVRVPVAKKLQILQLELDHLRVIGCVQRTLNLLIDVDFSLIAGQSDDAQAWREKTLL
jgi:hypothetical protein